MCSPDHATVLLNWFWEKLHLSCWASVFPSNQSSTKGKFFWAWIEMIQVLNKCFLNLHFSANFLAPEETLRFYFLYVKIRVRRLLPLGKILREWLQVRHSPLTWKSRTTRDSFVKSMVFGPRSPGLCVCPWASYLNFFCKLGIISNQSILEEINSEYSLEKLTLNFQKFGHLMQRAALWEKTLMLGKIEGRRRRGQQRITVGWHHWLNGHELEQTPGDSEGQESLVCCSPWGPKESDMT